MFPFEPLSELATERRQATNALRVWSRIVDIEAGTKINVGEKFTAEFTVMNIGLGADPPTESRGPVSFRNVSISVGGTQFADVVGGNIVNDPLVETLGTWERATKRVQFEAKMAIEQMIRWLSVTEPYANVKVHGQFDILKFFNVVQEEVFRADILPPPPVD